MSTVLDIISEARRNTYYRRVVYTGELSQLVVMCIPPRGEIGSEIHRAVEQTLVIVDGYGESILNGRRHPLIPGDVVVVTPGTRHNIVADPGEPLKLFTIYAPPNHIPGTAHRTRADAESDKADQAFGRSVGGY